MSDDDVVVEIEGPIATIMIDRPAARNAVSLAMADAIATGVKHADADPVVRVIVLRARGSVFSAGADLKELPPSRSNPEAARAYDTTLSAAADALASCAKPTVARIGGPALGGALAFVLACDIRLAASAASFRIPVARLGLLYGPGDTARLVEAIGPVRAKWMMMTGDGIDAETGLAWGLISAVYDDATFEERADEVVQALAGGAPLTIAYTKRFIDSQPESDDPLVDGAYQSIYSSGDPTEGLAAAREKRPPRFTGT